MDKGRIAAARQAKGTARETVGKAFGDVESQTEGEADEVGGKLQNVINRARDGMLK